jgi:hypothetical protein
VIHVLSGKGITNVAGVIRVSYPANSTLVITGTSSGKQFAKDINATSSAKAYIFLAPIGDASYTLTATNTAGETVSKQVYVAKDQVQSVTLAYFSATIKVTYPAKSSCVIKNSSGTQVAGDTNTGTAAKSWTATVGTTGTYTITATATDGSGKTKSTTVSITTNGQNVSATLTYELILFNGTDNTTVTGGWTFGSNPDGTSTFSNATISNKQIVYSQAGYGGIFTKKQIDVTNYKTLYCECTIEGYLEYAKSFGVSKHTNKEIMDSNGNMDSMFVAKKALAAGTYTGNNALSVDISKITGNCSLGFGVFCSLDLTIKINKVRLV